jgi:hypothetical protein
MPHPESNNQQEAVKTERNLKVVSHPSFGKLPTNHSSLSMHAHTCEPNYMKYAQSVLLNH